MALPERVTRQRDPAVETAPLLLGGEPASDDWCDGERLVVSFALERDADALGHIGAEERHVVPAEGDEAVEDLSMRARRHHVARRHVERVELADGAGDRVAHAHQPFAGREREQPEQEVVDGAEHRGVRADAERQDRHCDRRVPGRPFQQTDPVTQVLPQSVHGDLRAPSRKDGAVRDSEVEPRPCGDAGLLGWSPAERRRPESGRLRRSYRMN